jgi:hypothetical protein
VFDLISARHKICIYKFKLPIKYNLLSMTVELLRCIDKTRSSAAAS